ncbi:MAG: hypothetical protein R3Y26_01250 [Rikenellaceae bacterium]
MKNYIFLFLSLFLLTNNLYSQIKVSGGKTGEAPMMTSVTYVSQDYRTFKAEDEIFIFMVNAAPTDQEVKRKLVFRTKVENERSFVSTAIGNMKNDIGCTVIGATVGRTVPCKFENHEDYEGFKFSSDVLQTNKPVPVFLICRKELSDNAAIKELLETTDVYDIKKIRETLNNAGLGSENINIVFSRINRDEE